MYYLGQPEPDGNEVEVIDSRLSPAGVGLAAVSRRIAAASRTREAVSGRRLSGLGLGVGLWAAGQKRGADANDEPDGAHDQGQRLG